MSKEENKMYFYMGRHKIEIIKIKNKFATVKHIERGYIGSRKKGYILIEKGEFSDTHIANCYINKIDSKIEEQINKIKSKFEEWTNNPNLNTILKKIDIESRKDIINQYYLMLEKILLLEEIAYLNRN